MREAADRIRAGDQPTPTRAMRNSVNTNQHRYFVQAYADEGRQGIDSHKLNRWAGHHPRGLAQLIPCNTWEEVQALVARAERIGLRVGTARLNNRVENLKALRQIYPGASIARLNSMGFHI